MLLGMGVGLIVLYALIWLPLYWVFYQYYTHPLFKYPGPILASITNYWRYWEFLGGDLHTTDQKLHKRYGPIVRIGPNSLLFESLSAFRAIYGSNQHLEKGGFYDLAAEQHLKRGNMFNTKKQSQHREQRENVESAALTNRHMIQYRPTVSRNIRALLECFQFLYQDTPNQTIHIALGIHKFVFNTLFEIIYGRQQGFQLDPSDRVCAALTAQREFTQSIFGISLVPWLRSIHTSKLANHLWAAYDSEGLPAISAPSRPDHKPRVFSTTLNKLRRFSMFRTLSKFFFIVRLVLWGVKVFVSNLMNGLRGEMYDSHEQRIVFRMDPKPSHFSNPHEIGTPPSFNIQENIENILNTKGRRDKRKHLDSATVLGECSSFLFLGVGSTSAALTAILYYLGTHPEYQSSILDEHAKSTTSAKDFCLYPATLDHDPILRSVIKESLRLSPPFPSTFPRYVAHTAYATVPGLPSSLPVGTMVGSNIHVVCRLKDIWGKDANEWKPERWLDKKFMYGFEEGSKPLRGHRALEEVSVVFGRGSRSCAGKHIAWMVLAEAVVAILSEWEIVATPGSLKGRNAMEMQYDELKVQLKPRKGGSDGAETGTKEEHLTTG